MLKNFTLGDVTLDQCKMCGKVTHVQCRQCKQKFCWGCRITLCNVCPVKSDGKCGNCTYLCQDCWKVPEW